MTQSQQPKNDSTNSSTQSGAIDMTIMSQLVAQAVAVALASQPQAQSGPSEIQKFREEMLAQRDLEQKKALKKQSLMNKALDAKRKVSEAITREVKPGLHGGVAYEQHRCSLKTLLEAVSVFGVEAVETTIGGKISWTAASVGCKLNIELTQDELDLIELEVEKVK